VGGCVLAVCAISLFSALLGAVADEQAAGEAPAQEQAIGGFGIGLTAERTDEPAGIAVVVDLVLDEGPAAEAGIKKGDVITHVDGAPIAGIRLENVVDLIRGKPGTEVKLTVQRAGQEQPIEVTIERAEVQIAQRPADADQQQRLQAERAEAFERIAAEQQLPIRIQLGPRGERIVQFQRWLGASSPERMSAQLVVEGGYVYSLRGYTLYQFEVEGLELVAKSDLRTDQEKEAEMQ